MDRSVERQLAEQHQVRDLPALDDSGRREDPERDRRIERGARLADVRRREVDGDAMRRKLESGVADRGTNPVAALADARVGKADHRERREAERHVHFDLNRTRVDAEDRRGPQAGEHP